MMTATTLLHVDTPTSPQRDCDQNFFLGDSDVHDKLRFIQRFPVELHSRVVAGYLITGMGKAHADSLIAAIGYGQSYIWLDGHYPKLISKKIVLDEVQANILTARCLRAV